jgi:hypothetical protein
MDSDPAGVAAFRAIQQCIQDEGCVDFSGNLDQDCLNAQCADQLRGCGFFVPDEPMGEGSCNDYLTCINAANGNEARNDCVRATSPESYEMFEAVIDCLKYQHVLQRSGYARRRRSAVL